jgi:GNAT superfamily N-acetyltransferase
MRGTPEEENDPLQVYALDEHGELAGGLVGHTWGRWLHIGLLWVDEPARGSGLGTRLVARAEEIARDERRCLHARVESWDFQAPAF